MKYTLPLTSKGILRLTGRLRETHLDPQTDEALVQVSGDHIRIFISSDRDDIEIALDLQDFEVAGPFDRTIYRWGIDIDRWSDILDVDDETREIDATVRVIEPGVWGDE